MRKPIVGAILLAAATAGWSYIDTHKGALQAFYLEFRHANLHQFMNYSAFGLYIGDFLEELRLNAAGYYDLSTAIYVAGNGDPETLAQLKLHQGDFKGAIDLLESQIDAKGRSESRLFWLAASYMRYAEKQNCLARITIPAQNLEQIASSSHMHVHGRFCSLPIQEFHRQREWSERAAELFERLLDDYDADNKLYRWLLNFSYMTLDRFPDGVPQRYRIESAFIDLLYGDAGKRTEREYRHLVLEDRAHALGADVLDAGKGVAVEDFDRDGFLDIVTGGSYDPVRYLRNVEGRRFVDETGARGLADIVQTHIISAADFDNDGWIDLFFSAPFTYFRLYRNNQDGSFRDVTFEMGLLEPPISENDYRETWVSAWGDIDNDGDLDLFVGQRGQKIPYFGGFYGKRPMNSTLFINEGDRFVDRTAEWGLGEIVNNEVYVGAAFGDYDNDGDADLFISSMTRTKSFLLENVDGRRFQKSPLIEHVKSGFMAGFLDFNHDGRLDLFQGTVGLARTATELTVYDHTAAEAANYANTLFINEGGRFVDRAAWFDGDWAVGSMGASYGDINNDGCVDFYMGTGDPESWYVLPNAMYVGRVSGVHCVGGTDNVSMLHGLGTVQKGHGIVFFDFDNDGDQDIYSSLGGMWPADAWPNQLFVNASRLANTWVKIRLQGQRANRFGVGALIRIAAENAAGETIVRYYHMDNKTGFGSAPYLAHIGLMNAAQVKRVEVKWPGERGYVDYGAIPLNRLTTLQEPPGTVQSAAFAIDRSGSD